MIDTTKKTCLYQNNILKRWLYAHTYIHMFHDFNILPKTGECETCQEMSGAQCNFVKKKHIKQQYIYNACMIK